MSKSSYTPLENSGNQQNGNRGTSGINAAHQSALNNHANQCNPNNSLYQGGCKSNSGTRGSSSSKK